MIGQWCGLDFTNMPLPPGQWELGGITVKWVGPDPIRGSEQLTMVFRRMNHGKADRLLTVRAEVDLPNPGDRIADPASQGCTIRLSGTSVFYHRAEGTSTANDTRCILVQSRSDIERHPYNDRAFENFFKPFSMKDFTTSGMSSSITVSTDGGHWLEYEIFFPKDVPITDLGYRYTHPMSDDERGGVIGMWSYWFSCYVRSGTRRENERDCDGQLNAVRHAQLAH